MEIEGQKKINNDNNFNVTDIDENLTFKLTICMS